MAEKREGQNDFKLDHLSITQISMFLRCEFSYFQRYVLGIKKPPQSALTFGKAFDAGISANYEFKTKKGKDMPVSEVEEVFATSFEETAKETEWMPDENPARMKDEGIESIDLFHTEVCPTVQPEAVQVDRYLEFQNSSVAFQGKIDVLEKDGTISDIKTGSRIWSPGEEFREKQPVGYSLLLDRDSNRKRQFRFDRLIRTKKPKIQRVPLVVGPVERKGFLLFLSSVMQRIMEAGKSGIFLPRQDHFLCSRKYCGYHNTCSKTFGWRIKD